MTNLKLTDRINRGVAQYGDRFDADDLRSADANIRHAYEHGKRIKVLTGYGETITGTVSTTTGWRPSFLLVRRSNALGSSDLLGADDRVIAVKWGSRYETR